MKVTLNLITGPFVEPFLDEVLWSSAELFDELVFIDTAPGNNPNRKIMESWNQATIIDMPRKSDEEFSFAEARNLALEHTTTEWVLRLDADEIIPEWHLADIKLQLTRADVEGYAALEIAFWHHFLHPDLIRPLHGPEDKKPILMRRGTFTWSRPVHEGCHISGDILQAHDIKYNHYSYCRGQAAVKERWMLYKKLGGCPHSIEHIGPKRFLEEVMGDIQLERYQGEHPDIVIPKLKKMYPDLGKLVWPK